MIVAAAGRSKKLRRARGGHPRATRAGHTGRGVVPGRDAGRPEEQTHLSLGQEGLVDHCCYAWNTLIDQPWKIMSIAHRDWAIVGHSL